MGKIILTPLPKEPVSRPPISGRLRITDPSGIEVRGGDEMTVSEFLLQNAEKNKCFLYGIVDSARNDEVFRFLITGDAQYRSLFEGTMDVQSYGVSGFLVECKSESPLFQWMTSEAWGDHCCIYFISEASFDELFEHFQQFNRVYLEDDEVVLFRYYDPRVLRKYLPTCDDEEIDIFFGEVKIYFAESKDPGIMHIYTKNDRADTGKLHISSVRIKTI